MAQQSTTPITHAKEPGSAPCTFVVAHNHQQFPFHGIQCPFLASEDNIHACDKYIHALETVEHSNKNIFKKKFFRTNPFRFSFSLRRFDSRLSGPVYLYLLWTEGRLIFGSQLQRFESVVVLGAVLK